MSRRLFLNVVHPSDNGRASSRLGVYMAALLAGVVCLQGEAVRASYCGSYVIANPTDGVEASHGDPMMASHKPAAPTRNAPKPTLPTPCSAGFCNGPIGFPASPPAPPQVPTFDQLCFLSSSAGLLLDGGSRPYPFSSSAHPLCGYPCPLERPPEGV